MYPRYDMYRYGYDRVFFATPPRKDYGPNEHVFAPPPQPLLQHTFNFDKAWREALEGLERLFENKRRTGRFAKAFSDPQMEDS